MKPVGVFYFNHMERDGLLERKRLRKEKVFTGKEMLIKTKSYE